MAATPTDGFLLIDKPAGSTSQDIVTAVRRTLGASRAGHTGTLDPFATGLLIVLLGRATRVARFVPNAPKEYRARIAFGTETDTDDLTGAVTATAELPDESRVHQAIAHLTGRLQQVPPSYSAKHVEGRRAYAMARQGIAVSLPPVEVDVESWSVLEHSGANWSVSITCGSGVYVRALVRDLGRLAGSAAHVTALHRTRIGPFSVRDAISLDQLTSDTVPLPTRHALVEFAHVTLTDGQTAMVRQGRSVDAEELGSVVVLLDSVGEVVAVAERDGSRWQPRVVFGDA